MNSIHDAATLERLDAARADMGRFKALQRVLYHYKEDPAKERAFSLTDLPALEAAIVATPDGPPIVIDPISSYCGKTDSHKNAEVGGLIAPLMALAAKYRVAVVCNTHHSQSSNGPAIYRVIGSIAFAAAARAVWTVTKDKDNPRRRLMLPAQNNLVREAATQAAQQPARNATQVFASDKGRLVEREGMQPVAIPCGDK